MFLWIRSHFHMYESHFHVLSIFCKNVGEQRTQRSRSLTLGCRNLSRTSTISQPLLLSSCMWRHIYIRTQHLDAYWGFFNIHLWTSGMSYFETFLSKLKTSEITHMSHTKQLSLSRRKDLIWYFRDIIIIRNMGLYFCSVAFFLQYVFQFSHNNVVSLI